MRTLITLGVLLVPACSHASIPQTQDEQIRAMREELVKALLQNLDLNLRLARATNKPDEEMRVLAEALGSPHTEVHTAALRELGALAEDRRKAGVPAVLARFARGEPSFRIPAVAFLGRVPSPLAERAVIEATRDPSAPVRRAAAAAVKTLPEEKSGAPLVALLKDPDKEVRQEAAQALGSPRRESAVAPLVAALGEEREDAVIEKIADALGVIGSTRGVEPLLRVLESTARREVRWSCINSLGRIGDARAADRLRAFLDSDRAPDVRLVAIDALGKLKDTAVLPRLAEILRADPDETLRQGAAAAIGLMGSAAEIEPVLLSAFLKDGAEKVRQAAWSAMMALASDSFPVCDVLATGLLKAGRRADVEQLCVAKLHALKPTAATKARFCELEGAIARAALEARDPKAALAHLRQIAGHAPERTDVLQQIADCCRELKDGEARLKALRDLDARLPKGEAAWWANRLEILAALREGKDPEPAIEEAHALLATNPPPHPEDRRKALDATLRSATLRLIQPLAAKEEPARKAALDAVKRLGRKLIPALAAELEESAKAAPATVEAGNAIAGTTFEPSTGDPAKLKEFAAAWKAWFEAGKPRGSP